MKEKMDGITLREKIIETGLFSIIKHAGLFQPDLQLMGTDYACGVWLGEIMWGCKGRLKEVDNLTLRFQNVLEEVPDEVKASLIYHLDLFI